MVHIQRRLVGGGSADYLRRHPGNRGMRWDIFQDHAARADLGALPHVNIAQDLGAGADQDPIADLGMAIALVLASATQGHRLQNGNVVADHGGLAYDQPGGVVEHDPLTHAGSRVDVHAEGGGHAILEKQRQGLPAAVPQPVRHSLGLQGVKTLEIQERHIQFVAGGVAVQHRLQVCPDGLPDGIIALEGLQDDVPQQQGRRCGAVQLMGQVKAQRALQRGVIDDSGVKKAGQHRFLPGVTHGFLSNAIP